MGQLFFTITSIFFLLLDLSKALDPHANGSQLNELTERNSKY